MNEENCNSEGISSELGKKTAIRFIFEWDFSPYDAILLVFKLCRHARDHAKTPFDERGRF